jgi:hypothetical protein
MCVYVPEYTRDDHGQAVVYGDHIEMTAIFSEFSEGCKSMILTSDEELLHLT